MPKGKTKKSKLDFTQKLLLNQWLISLFGVDPLADGYERGKKPFHHLVEHLRVTREGLDADGFHHFYHELKDGDFFRMGCAKVTAAELQAYEENIVSHTAAINAGRPHDRQIKWKYFQWLALLFTEVYLDRYFRDRAALLADLNQFVAAFNAKYDSYEPMTPYREEDLNKVCFQNATGSGKTLLMHVHLKQFWHYAKKAGKDGGINFPFLITPNDRLSKQHRDELAQSGITGVAYTKSAGGELEEFLYTLEIQKIQKEDGPETFAVRNFGDNNLLFVDECHAGLAGKNVKQDEAAWMKYRAQLCEKGFSFEYSATFAQAVKGTNHEDDYAKSILFDYSYRWFYEDGYGKDYQIYNLPKTFATTQFVYLTGCLLKYYQQLRIYEERKATYAGFNLEKPLWVFVGSTVSGGKKLEKGDLVTATDVAQIIAFIGEFLGDSSKATDTISDLLLKSGADTGMLDAEGNDFFHGAFDYLVHAMNGDTANAAVIYQDILKRLFNGTSSGKLQVERLKGNAGEILLRAPLSEANRPFGLINVGSPKELCDHLKALPELADRIVFADESEVTEPIFQTVRESSSSVNLLVGSKKFVEGWDCWRVSTLGLMHVGKSEGAQIIQLFGRGVRLKGWEWSLKRSNRSGAPVHPVHIHELELLNVFGIEADFMQKFKEYLKSEGLPGNEKRRFEKIPLNVTYDFGKKLKIIRPKRKKADGMEYDFKKDAPVPFLGAVDEDSSWWKFVTANKVVADWYPRVQSAVSKSGATHEGVKNRATLDAAQLGMLDCTELYFALERFKRERTWHNLDVTVAGIRDLLGQKGWYDLFVPEAMVKPTTFAGVRVLQDVAAELLKRYAEKLYDYSRRQFIEPRLEIRELTKADENIPNVADYVFNVDADDATVLNQIQTLRTELAKKVNAGKVLKAGDIEAINFDTHIFSPIFHLKKQGEISIQPVALNDSEFRFVSNLCEYVKKHQAEFQPKGQDIYLLRNMSRGKGVGFAEASNFHPDFILWLVEGAKQYITFVEPHGLLHENAESDKIKFAERIKQIEKRLGDPNVILNSFILSPTPYQGILWMPKPLKGWLADHHVLFLDDGGDSYLKDLFERILAT